MTLKKELNTISDKLLLKTIDKCIYLKIKLNLIMTI